jgi:hypothetical protein
MSSKDEWWQWQRTDDSKEWMALGLMVVNRGKTEAIRMRSLLL